MAKEPATEFGNEFIEKLLPVARHRAHQEAINLAGALTRLQKTEKKLSDGNVLTAEMCTSSGQNQIISLSINGVGSKERRMVHIEYALGTNSGVNSYEVTSEEDSQTLTLQREVNWWRQKFTAKETDPDGIPQTVPFDKLLQLKVYTKIALAFSLASLALSQPK